MATKLTSRDLVGSLIELQLEKDDLDLKRNSIECSIEQDNEWEEEEKRIEKGIAEIKSELTTKVSGLDHMIVEMNKKKGNIDSEIKALTDEIKRLRNRKNAISRTEDYFNKELIPLIVETCGNDGILITDTARYKVYETWGPIVITDEESISDNYKRYKVEIDKKKARRDFLEASKDGLGITGFKLEKVKRIRRS